MAVSFLPKNYVEDNGFLTGIQNLLDMKVKERQMKQLGLPKNMAGMDPRIITQLLQNKQKESQNQIVQDFLNAKYGQPQQSGFQQLVGESGELSQPEQIVEAPQQFQQQPQQQGPSELQAIMALPSDIRRDLLKEREYERRDKRAIEDRSFKETKEFRKDLSSEAKTAKDDLLAIKGQLEQVKGGKMMGKGSVLAVDVLGNFLGLNEAQKTALKDDSSVIFEKYGIRYLSSLKDIFGARPTQWDAQQFQKGFPSLYQSKEGQEAILGDMKTAAKLKIRKKKIEESIIAKNKNIPPIDLEAKINKSMEPIQKKAWAKSSARMKSILNKNAPDNKSAIRFGKGRKITNDDGLVYISDGRKWKVKFDEE